MDRERSKETGPIVKICWTYQLGVGLNVLVSIVSTLPNSYIEKYLVPQSDFNVIQSETKRCDFGGI